MKNSRRTKEQLKAHILETEHILQGVTDHPVMRNTLQKRLKKLKKQLEEISPGIAQSSKYNNWLVSKSDCRIFFHTLLNPPAPNTKLKAAMKKHGRLKKPQ